MAKRCETCAELGDDLLAEMCEVLGPECKEIEQQFRSGKISPAELLGKLKDKFDPDQVSALVNTITAKHR